MSEDTEAEIERRNGVKESPGEEDKTAHHLDSEGHLDSVPGIRKSIHG